MGGDGDVIGSDEHLKYWVLMTICSAISLGSFCAETKQSWFWDAWDAFDKFVISVGAIVMSIGAVYSVLLMRKTKEMIYEFPASSLCLIFWAIALGFLFYKSSYWWHLNIYYFSWGALVSATLLFIGYLKDFFDVDNDGRMVQRGYRFTVWSVLCASSAVVMSSSTNIYYNFCNYDYEKTLSYCKRAALGIGLGASSTVLALAMLALFCFKKNNLIVEGVLPALICVAFAVGVGFITGPLGPANDEVGNLYYSIWITFLASVLLLLDRISEFTAKRINQQEDGNEARVPEGPKIENA